MQCTAACCTPVRRRLHNVAFWQLLFYNLIKVTNIQHSHALITEKQKNLFPLALNFFCFANIDSMVRTCLLTTDFYLLTVHSKINFSIIVICNKLKYFAVK